MIQKVILFLAIAIILQACESNVEIKVTCKDSVTKEFIPDVQVNVNAGMNGDYTKSTAQGKTNENGFFETDLMIGCPGKCYDIYITYIKSGYKIKEDLNITSGDIFLEQE